MKNFNDVYKMVFSPIMKSKGFEYKRRIYHRMVNKKIIQMLSYQTFQHQTFTIQFGIYPLCAGFEYETFMDGERLSEVFGIDEWVYNDYFQQLPNSLAVSEKYIFPYFESCLDYGSYLENMNKLFGILFRNNKKGIPINYSMVFDLNLTLGNYKQAQESREASIKMKRDYFIKRWGIDSCPYAERQRDYEEMCSSYLKMKKAMEENDRKYIEEYIRSNEEKSLKSYFRNFFGIKAHDNYIKHGILPL